MSVMGTYQIPLIWQVYGKVTVEAASLREAVDYALGPECPLPEGDYLDESVMVDEAVLELDCPEFIEEYCAVKQSDSTKTTMVDGRV